jgi:ATP-dependent Zn protease
MGRSTNNCEAVWKFSCLLCSTVPLIIVMYLFISSPLVQNAKFTESQCYVQNVTIAENINLSTKIKTSTYIYTIQWNVHSDNENRLIIENYEDITKARERSSKFHSDTCYYTNDVTLWDLPNDTGFWVTVLVVFSIFFLLVISVYTWLLVDEIRFNNKCYSRQINV